MSSDENPVLRSKQVPDHVKYFRNGLCRAVGLQSDDLEKPIIGVVHAWNEMGPGDFHLKQVAEHVKEGVRSAGGTPIEIVVSGLCAGISNGTEFSSYSLPYRDFAAAMVEIMLQGYVCDGAVVVPTCDYTVPAFLMGIARVNIPSIVVTGGYMQPGEYDGRPVVMTDVKIAYGKYKAGNMNERELQILADNVCPTVGACPILGTANTMCVVTEALGMSLPGAASTSAVSARLVSNAKSSGKANYAISSTQHQTLRHIDQRGVRKRCHNDIGNGRIHKCGGPFDRHCERSGNQTGSRHMGPSLAKNAVHLPPHA